MIATLWIAAMVRDLFFDSFLPVTQHVANWICPYARTSVVLGVITLVTGVRRFRMPRVALLELAGRYSLGLFAFHKWAFYFCYLVVVPLLGLSWHADLVPVMVTVLAVGVTCGTVALLSRIGLKYLVV